MTSAITRTRCLFGFLLLLAVFDGCCLVAMGQNALSIDGPYEAKPGELVSLEPQELEASEQPYWIVLKPVDLQYKQIGKDLVFAVPCDQKSDIVALVLAQRIVNNEIITRQLRRTITVERGPPDVDPDEPDEPDDPDSPPVESEFQKLITGYIKEYIKPTADLAQEIAMNFDLTANRVEAGEFTTVREFSTHVATLNSDSLGEQREVWKPWAVLVQAEINKGCSDGQCDMNDNVRILRECAAGIRKAVQ